MNDPAVDMEAAERTIRRANLVAMAALAVALPAGWFLLPALFEFPRALAERLAFAAVCSAVVFACVLVAILMVSTGRRFSPQDIRGSAHGPPSRVLAVRAAFLQNTLEQAVIAAGMYFALAALAGGAWLSLIVVAVAFFVVGRVLFFRGYTRGPVGRAQGMTLTMLPTVAGYLLVFVLMAIRAFTAG